MIFIKAAIFLGILLLCDSAAVEPSNDIESDGPRIGRRIWGGNWAYYSHKMTARIEPTFPDLSTGRCSGVAISDRIILTTATCLLRNNTKPFFIQVRIFYNDYTFWSTEVKIHPDFSSGNKTANIAAIKISTNRNALMGLSSSDFPTVLDSQTNFDLEDSVAVVAGWGKVSANGHYDLYYADVNTIANENCKIISVVYGGGDIAPQQLCSVDTNKGVCHGDEGGPLLIKGRSKNYLVAITTDSIASCSKFGPTIYTRITPYKSWINQLMFQP